MSKSVPQNAAYQSVGTAADTLADKVTAFTTAKTAADTASANLVTAKTALDTAWVDFKAKDATFDSLMLVAPDGYTPPT
jgi:hypothetical protein